MKLFLALLMTLSLVLIGCDGLGGDPASSVRVTQLCEEDTTTITTVNASLDCDKSHHNKTAPPFVVEVPSAPE